VSLADQNYLDCAKQLFSGIYHNSGWDGDYMLLAHQVSKKDIDWFRSRGILVKECEPIYYHLVGKEKYPPLVFDVFYLFTEEFKKWENIVFLDADIIVRSSLKRLTKIKGFASPHVIDDKLKYYFYNDINKSQHNELKSIYNLEKPAFNCVVMAFSTDIIKANMLFELKQLYEQFQQISSGLDPTLNLYFYNNWKRLPIAYDVTPEKIEKLTGKNKDKIEGIIVHLKDSELSYEDSNLSKEWHANLDKAELINVSKPFPAKEWSRLKTNVFSFKIYFSFFFKKTLKQLYVVLKVFAEFLECCVGKVGELVKRINKNLYNKLKNA